MLRGGYDIFVATEVKIGKGLVIGPKIGFWSASQAAGYGATLIYYTDLEQGAVRLRPEIGFGMSRVKIAYGYNFLVYNKHFERLNKHNFGVNVVLVPPKRKKG